MNGQIHSDSIIDNVIDKHPNNILSEQQDVPKDESIILKEKAKECCILNPLELTSQQLEIFSCFNLCVKHDNQFGAKNFANHFYKNGIFVNEMFDLYYKYCNAFERSACIGHTNCVKKILPYIHPDIRIIDDTHEYDDWTPFENSVVVGDIEIIGTLIKGSLCARPLPSFKIHKASVNTRDLYMRTPLLQSVQGTGKNVYDVVKLLIESGGNVKLCDNAGYNIVMETLRLLNPSETLKILMYLYDNNLIDMSYKHLTGLTPLHYAAYFSDKHVIRFLLKCGFECDSIVRGKLLFRNSGSLGYYYQTPLLLAANSHKIGENTNAFDNLLELLLNKNVNIYNMDRDGHNVFDICNINDSVYLRQYILKYSGFTADIARTLALIWWMEDCNHDYLMSVFSEQVLKIPPNVYDQYQSKDFKYHHWWFCNQIIIHGGTYSVESHNKIEKMYNFRKDLIAIEKSKKCLLNTKLQPEMVSQHFERLKKELHIIHFRDT